MSNEWGPLAGLAGEWEGEGGVDRAFKHSQNVVFDTDYREKCTMKPFGPVENGSQVLYGLDYTLFLVALPFLPAASLRLIRSSGR